MLPRTQEGQQGGGAGTPKRKPAVRRDPEKRRYQNLQAQKKYREKLRQRLKRLEALAETAAHGRPTSQVPAAGQGLSAAVNTSSTAQGDNFATAVPHSAPGALASSLSTTATHYSQLAPQLGNFPLDLDFWNPNEYAPLLDDPSLLGTRDPTVLPLSDETIWYPPQVEPTRGSNTSEDTIHGAINYASLPAVSSTFISTASNNSVTNTDRGEYTNRPSLAWTTTVGCGCSNPHFTIQSGCPFSANPRQVKIFATMPIADPYVNNSESTSTAP